MELAEGYRWIFSILAVGLDAHVWADTDCPQFTEIVGPTKKWGGDNADAYYRFAAIDPARTYTVRGRRGDAAYLSLTVYGGPSDGHYSERIVAQINDRDMVIEDDGTFTVVLSPHAPGDATGSWLRLESDAVCLITRDYLEQPRTGLRADWSIEADDPPPTTQLTPPRLARGFRAATTWLIEQAQLCPIRVDPPNTVQEPYPVPTTTFGWAAGDAAYAMGSYELDDDQALVIEGQSPRGIIDALDVYGRDLTLDPERLCATAALLEIRDRGACPCGHTRTLLQQRVDQVGQELRRLHQLQEELTDMLSGLDDCADVPAGSWWCETEFTKKGGDRR